jgi:hypothetical protein
MQSGESWRDALRVRQDRLGQGRRIQTWRQTGPAEELRINDEPAVRLTFTGPVAGKSMTREVTAFRRGERVTLFTGMNPAGDSKARDEIRRAVGNVLWKKQSVGRRQ